MSSTCELMLLIIQHMEIQTENGGRLLRLNDVLLASALWKGRTAKSRLLTSAIFSDY